jgi:hypothetical protein
MRIRTALGLIGLIVGMAFLGACQRTSVTEPSPTGPSTIFQTFTMTANPNVVYATDSRPTSEIKVVVKRGNSPVKDAVVYFSIFNGPGYFSDYTRRVAVLSNENGVAAVLYLGPLKTEISADQSVTFRAILESSDPEPIYKEVWISILRGN